MYEEKKDILKKYLATIEEVNAKGKYHDNWESLKDHKVPTWYQKAKFGIFIHWGVFSVPAYGSEWYPRFMYKTDKTDGKYNNVREHHLAVYGPTKKFGYKDFIPLFKAEKFDPAHWAHLFKEAGAQFVMPVAEHHDGFQMYQSDLSNWNAAEMGPHKDILGQLKGEIEKEGLVFTASSHRAEHYWFMGGMREEESDFDPETVQYGDMYWPSKPEPFGKNEKGQYDLWQVSGFSLDTLYMEDWLARTCELVDKYQPLIVYFDWWIQVEPMKPYLKKFAAYYYNRAEEWGKEVTINYKNDAFMFHSAVRDLERGQLKDVSPDFWQDDTSVAKNSWCYTVGNDYKEPHEIIENLVDICSKNGSLLLNIGPKSDGTIPEEDTHILKEIGAWLQINGEAIYGSSYWKVYGEGPTVNPEGHMTDTLTAPYTSEDFRFTYKNEQIYAFSMHWPKNGTVKIKAFGNKSKVCNALIKNIEILGGHPCTSTQEDDYLIIHAEGLHTENPVCIKISID